MLRAFLNRPSIGGGFEGPLGLCQCRDTREQGCLAWPRLRQQIGALGLRHAARCTIILRSTDWSRHKGRHRTHQHESNRQTLFQHSPFISKFWEMASTRGPGRLLDPSCLDTPERCAFCGHSPATRVYLLIQFTSQVLPPSSEKACSDCAVSSVIFQIENRTSTERPLIRS